MLFFSLLFFNISFAEVARVSSTQTDLSKVQKIYLSPGLVSLIEFPSNIVEVRIGNPESVKAIISQASPKELTLLLTHHGSTPSNLIVRAEKRVFIFDLVPSQSLHQDFIKVRGAFGSPTSDQNLKVVVQQVLEPKDNDYKQKYHIKKTKRLTVSP